jgi:hypothetical protein
MATSNLRLVLFVSFSKAGSQQAWKKLGVSSGIEVLRDLDLDILPTGSTYRIFSGLWHLAPVAGFEDSSDLYLPLFPWIPRYIHISSAQLLDPQKLKSS